MPRERSTTLPDAPFKLRMIAALLALAVLLTGRAAWAHPHVWILADVNLRGSGGVVEALEVVWAFDEMYSALVIQDFDINGNGALDPEELQTIARMSTEALKEVNYFTVLALDERRLPVAEVEELVVRVEDGVLIYSFRVPLPKTVDPRQVAFGFALYDQTYYVDVQLNGRGAVKVSDQDFAGCRPIPTEDEANPIYFGMVYPLLVRISCEERRQDS